MVRRGLVGVGCALGLGVGCGEAALAPLDAGRADDANRPAAESGAGGTIVGPDTLAATGLYGDFARRTLAAGVIPYTLRTEPWSDGEARARYFYLPPGAIIDTGSMDYWTFPVGAKAWQEFRIGGKLVETRYLWKVRRDAWWSAAYLWAGDGSAAPIAPPGGVKKAAGMHDVPSRQDCARCHTNVPDEVIGFGALQLSDGGKGLLSKLALQGRLSEPPAGEFEVPGEGVVKDALWYLHANCAYCHNKVGNLTQQSALATCIEAGESVVSETCVYETAPFLMMRHITPPSVWMTLVPGAPQQGGLWLRMLHRDDGWEMPPIGTHTVDAQGAATIERWIREMPCAAPACVAQ